MDISLNLHKNTKKNKLITSIEGGGARIFKKKAKMKNYSDKINNTIFKLGKIFWKFENFLKFKLIIVVDTYVYYCPVEGWN